MQNRERERDTHTDRERTIQTSKSLYRMQKDIYDDLFVLEYAILCIHLHSSKYKCCQVAYVVHAKLVSVRNYRTRTKCVRSRNCILVIKKDE